MREAKARVLIDMETLDRIAPVIRHAAHPLRLRIIDYLRGEEIPCTVGEITRAAGAGQATVSQQLRVLRDLGVLSAHREGQHVYYRVAEPSVFLLLDCIRGECCHQAN